MGITSWDVYWVMQLDSITSAAAFVFGLCCFLAFIAGMMWFIESPGNTANAALKMLKRLAVIGGFALLVGTFVPSSRTAAAMILVPKLTSPDVLEPVGKEAKELYGLAKSALRKIAGDKPEKGK